MSKKKPKQPSKKDHQELIRVYCFFHSISHALQGQAELLGKARGIARAVLDELVAGYEAKYGPVATEKLLTKIAAEFNPPAEDQPNAQATEIPA